MSFRPKWRVGGIAFLGVVYSTNFSLREVCVMWSLRKTSWRNAQCHSTWMLWWASAEYALGARGKLRAGWWWISTHWIHKHQSHGRGRYIRRIWNRCGGAIHVFNNPLEQATWRKWGFHTLPSLGKLVYMLQFSQLDRTCTDEETMFCCPATCWWWSGGRI